MKLLIIETSFCYLGDCINEAIKISKDKEINVMFEFNGVPVVVNEYVNDKEVKEYYTKLFGVVS